MSSNQNVPSEPLIEKALLDKSSQCKRAKLPPPSIGNIGRALLQRKLNELTKKGNSGASAPTTSLLQQFSGFRRANRLQIPHIDGLFGLMGVFQRSRNSVLQESDAIRVASATLQHRIARATFEQSTRILTQALRFIDVPVMASIVECSLARVLSFSPPFPKLKPYIVSVRRVILKALQSAVATQVRALKKICTDTHISTQDGAQTHKRSGAHQDTRSRQFWQDALSSVRLPCGLIRLVVHFCPDVIVYAITPVLMRYALVRRKFAQTPEEYAHIPSIQARTLLVEVDHNLLRELAITHALCGTASARWCGSVSNLPPLAQRERVLVAGWTTEGGGQRHRAESCSTRSALFSDSEDEKSDMELPQPQPQPQQPQQQPQPQPQQRKVPPAHYPFGERPGRQVSIPETTTLFAERRLLAEASLWEHTMLSLLQVCVGNQRGYACVVALLNAMFHKCGDTGFMSLRLALSQYLQRTRISPIKSVHANAFAQYPNVQKILYASNTQVSLQEPMKQSFVAVNSALVAMYQASVRGSTGHTPLSWRPHACSSSLAHRPLIRAALLSEHPSLPAKPQRHSTGLSSPVLVCLSHTINHMLNEIVDVYVDSIHGSISQAMHMMQRFHLHSRSAKNDKETDKDSEQQGSHSQAQSGLYFRTILPSASGGGGAAAGNGYAGSVKRIASSKISSSCSQRNDNSGNNVSVRVVVERWLYALRVCGLGSEATSVPLKSNHARSRKRSGADGAADVVLGKRGSAEVTNNAQGLNITSAQLLSLAAHTQRVMAKAPPVSLLPVTVISCTPKRHVLRHDLLDSAQSLYICRREGADQECLRVGRSRYERLNASCDTEGWYWYILNNNKGKSTSRTHRKAEQSLVKHTHTGIKLKVPTGPSVASHTLTPFVHKVSARSERLGNIDTLAWALGWMVHNGTPNSTFRSVKLLGDEIAHSTAVVSDATHDLTALVYSSFAFVYGLHSLVQLRGWQCAMRDVSNLENAFCIAPVCTLEMSATGVFADQQGDTHTERVCVCDRWLHFARQFSSQSHSQEPEKASSTTQSHSQEPEKASSTSQSHSQEPQKAFSTSRSHSQEPEKASSTSQSHSQEPENISTVTPSACVRWRICGPIFAAAQSAMVPQHETGPEQDAASGISGLRGNDGKCEESDTESACVTWFDKHLVGSIRATHRNWCRWLADESVYDIKQHTTSQLSLSNGTKAFKSVIRAVHNVLLRSTNDECMFAENGLLRALFRRWTRDLSRYQKGNHYVENIGAIGENSSKLESDDGKSNDHNAAGTCANVDGLISFHLFWQSVLRTTAAVVKSAQESHTRSTVKERKNHIHSSLHDLHEQSAPHKETSVQFFHVERPSVDFELRGCLKFRKLAFRRVGLKGIRVFLTPKVPLPEVAWNAVNMLVQAMGVVCTRWSQLIVSQRASPTSLDTSVPLPVCVMPRWFGSDALTTYWMQFMWLLRCLDVHAAMVCDCPRNTQRLKCAWHSLASILCICLLEKVCLPMMGAVVHILHEFGDAVWIPSVEQWFVSCCVHLDKSVRKAFANTIRAFPKRFANACNILDMLQVLGGRKWASSRQMHVEKMVERFEATFNVGSPVLNQTDAIKYWVGCVE